jgi:hypothetical protein
MHRAEFDKKYQQRSQVESVFSMMKAKFRVPRSPAEQDGCGDEK